MAKPLKKKKDEFAPGIKKDKKIKPIRHVEKYGPNEVWPFALQFHDARKAGKHYDIRLVDPAYGYGHSWAVPKAKWPEPGEKVRIIRTPTHSKEYSLRTGEWDLFGYGQGTVKAVRLEPSEVVKADDRHIRLNLYGPGQNVEELSILQTKKGDYLYNHTVTDEKGVTGTGGYKIPHDKPKYKDALLDQIDIKDEDEVVQPKLDGAHVLVGLKAGKHLRVFSYRKSKKNKGLIEHTHRFKDWHKRVAPPGLGGTVLRAEAWATNGDGTAVPASQVAGILNTDVWQARAKAPDLRLSAFDVVKYKGRDVSNAPYEEKLRILEEIKDKVPGVEVPQTAKTPREKAKLIKDIKLGKYKDTDEGVVVWNKKNPGVPPVRAKNTMEAEGKIVGFTQGQGSNKGIGAIQFKELDGKEITNVGTGISNTLREDMRKNPELYKGLVVRVKALGKHSSGKLRAPVFKDFHVDKNDPNKLNKVLNKEAGLLDPAFNVLKRVRTRGLLKRLPRSERVVDPLLSTYFTEKAQKELAGKPKAPKLRYQRPLGKNYYKVKQSSWKPALIGAGVGAGVNIIARKLLESEIEKDKSNEAELTEKQIEQLQKIMDVSPKIIRRKDMKEIEAFAVPFKDWGEVAGVDTDKLTDEGAVVLPKGKSPGWVTSHELGHMQTKKKLGPAAYSVLNTLHGFAGLGGLALFSAGMLKKSPRLAAAGAILGTTGTVATLGDELAASAHGYKGLKALGTKEEDLKKARKKMGLAYATYLSAIPFAVGMGASVYKMAKKIK